MLDEHGSISAEHRTRPSTAGQPGNIVRTNSRALGSAQAGHSHVPYRLYKMRFAGVVGIVALSVVAGMNLPWFGPIANETSDAFGISLDEVNWLGNIVGVTYLVVAPLVPIFCSRYGLRACFLIGTLFLIASAWVRYAGTAHSLSPRGTYALLIIGQFLSAIPQVTFQVLAPKFSESWFNLQGRTTATMIMSLSNPVGGAIGQLVSPLVTDPRSSVLVLGIISTAVSPFVLLIGSKPPTPPSYSGSQSSPHLFTTLRAILGLLPRPAYDGNCEGISRSEALSCGNPPLVGSSSGHKQEKDGRELGLESPITLTLEDSVRDEQVDTGVWETSGDTENATSTRDSGKQDRDGRVFIVEQTLDGYMTLRERVDFIILSLVFGVLLAGVNTFSLLSNEILGPYGYSEDTAGFMGAALLLSGLASAFVTAPLFDRIFTHHLGRAVRIFSPPIAAAWLALIWAARENNTAALYALLVIIGVCSLSILPAALELGCELTRNSEASSAILWFSGNLFGIIFILVMSALRAPASASPPLNMHRALIFNGATIFATTMSILLFRGRQRRRERDVRAAKGSDLDGNGSVVESESESGKEREREKEEQEGSDSADGGRSRRWMTKLMFWTSGDDLRR